MEMRLYATRVPDDRPGEEPKLVVVQAACEEEARRESALIDCDFHVAGEAELDEWDATTTSPLSESDVEMMLSLVGKYGRRLARIRSRAKAEEDGLIARVHGVGASLTEAGRARLRELGGDDNGSVTDLLSLMERHGTDPLSRTGARGFDIDRYRARKIAELRGKLEMIGREAEEDDRSFLLADAS